VIADALSLERVTVDRGGRTVVDDVSLSLALAPGDIVAVVGPNAGKSSLLERSACGRWHPGGHPARIRNCGVLVKKA